jgi:acetyl-CoA C-acetyltransferase
MGQGHDLVIFAATRTAIGRFQGALKDVPVTELGAAVIRESVRRAGIEPSVVDEVLMGHVLQAGTGQAPARQSALLAGLPTQVGATTLNKVCGSGLKAVMLGAAMIRAGDASVVLAGGMESMNGAPYLLPRARFGYRLGEGTMLDAMVHDGLWCAMEHQHMGLAAEWIAEAYQASREEMDAWALSSHQRAVAAMDRGAFGSEIAPLELTSSRGSPVSLHTDECPRRDTSIDKLAKLAPAFRADGRVTAGNSSAIADGAAALLVMRRERARELGCVPLGRIIAYGQAAVAPLEVFTAPIFAARRVAKQAGIGLQDLDLVELNEAFAAQVVADIRALDFDSGKVNVNGGAIALGHPIGASGCRILVTLLHSLRERRVECGMAAACLGGGEAVAMIVAAE